MPEATFSGFRRMLKRLRKKLNNPELFEDLVYQGVKEIMIRGRNLYSSESFDPNCWNGQMEFNPTVDRSACRMQLELLRDTLNDKELFDQLSLIGSCGFIFSNPEEDPEGWEMDHDMLMYTYTAEDCCPNTDWSINALGAEPRIWFHS